MSHYDVLGVAPDAGAAEVRAAYLRAARRHHPDRVAGADAADRAAAEARMREVNEAWRVLGHPGRRRAYDLELGMQAADDGFRPFDPTEPPDPHDLPDRPYRPAPSSPLERLVTVAPVALFAVAVAALLGGMVLSSNGLMALGGVAFILACVGVVAVALLSLARAARDE